MVMNKRLLKEYITLVVDNLITEITTTSTSATTGTSSTTSTISSTGTQGTTATAATTRTGTTEADREADTNLSNIEDKVDANAEKINSINANLTASRGDATKMSTKTREIQGANRNIEKNVKDAADNTERLRDARDREQQTDAYSKTATALRGVADNVGTIAAAQANVADILNRQGSRAPTETT